MKICLVYATKRKQATVQIVQWMREALEGAGHSVTVGKAGDSFDLACDRFILGTAVYAFSAQRAGLAQFIRKNASQLSAKPLHLFLVCVSDPLPAHEESTERGFKKFLKYLFLDPHRYLGQILRWLPVGAVRHAFFKGYQDPKERGPSRFDQQESAVKAWALSCAE